MKVKNISNKSLYCLSYKCKRDPEDIKVWIRDNCSGECEIEYSSKSNQINEGQLTELILKFENDNDRSIFKNMILDKTDTITKEL